MRLNTKTIWLCCALVLLLALGFTFYWLSHVQVHPQWSYRVLANNIPRISAIAFRDDFIYVTQEFAYRKGTILKISNWGDSFASASLPSDSHQQVVVGELSKPDGMIVVGENLIVTQEQGYLPVLSIDRDFIATELFIARNAEGITSSATKIYVVEDLDAEGRVLAYDLNLGTVSTVITGLKTVEGICVMGDSIYLVSKDAGEFSRWQGNERTIIASDLYKPGFVFCDAATNSIWITEESSRRGRLLRYAKDEFQVIAENLHAPQTVVVRGNSVYVAEQNRGRILVFQEK